MGGGGVAAYALFCCPRTAAGLFPVLVQMLAVEAVFVRGGRLHDVVETPEGRAHVREASAGTGVDGVKVAQATEHTVDDGSSLRARDGRVGVKLARAAAGIETMKALPQEVLQKTYWGGDFYFGYDNAATKEFADTYKAAFGEYPMDYSYYGYAALKIWASACEKAGTFDTDPVVNAIETISGDFGAGEMKFSWAHNCQGTYYVMTGKTDEELAAGDADDFMKVVTTKSGEQYSITKEEAMSYPVVLSTNR